MLTPGEWAWCYIHNFSVLPRDIALRTPARIHTDPEVFLPN
jgi:hypothetical protein